MAVDPINIRVGGKYSLVKKIGEGAFGEIYIAQSLGTNERVAVKLENKKKGHNLLFYEAKVYKHLSGSPGIPYILYFGIEGDFNVLVMELLGPSLDELLCFCGGKFRLRTTLMIADQALSRIEHIHANRFIHRDLKPDNLAVGLGSRSNIIYLFDFGLAKQYKNPKTHKHIPYKDNKELTGTVRYASLNTHLGIEQSRRDDLESLGFVFIYFMKGCLPWQGLPAKNQKEKYQKILKKMLSTSIESLCQGLPIEFVKYFQHARGLKFEQKPDYQSLRRMFKELFYKKECNSEVMFDWTLKYKKQMREKLLNGKTTSPPTRKESGEKRARILEGLQQVELEQVKDAGLDNSGTNKTAGTPVKESDTPDITEEKQETRRNAFLIENFVLIKEQLEEEYQHKEDKKPKDDKVEEDKKLPNENDKPVPSTVAQCAETKKEQEDKDKTPRLANPVGFKRVKTMDCFADCMDIPNENNSPVTLPYSPTAVVPHRNKRMESAVVLPGKKFSTKILPQFKRLNEQ